MIWAVAAVANAQQPNTPHAGYVYPAGGQQGSTIHVTVGGQFLEGVSRVLVSGRGIQARVSEYDKPLNPREVNALRERLQELQKNANDPAARREMANLRERLGQSLRRLSNLPISELVTLEIAIAPDAELGMRWLRLATPIGLSNPLIFCVGQLPEFRERDGKEDKADSELTVTLPAVVNGRIVPGEVDRARFPLRQPLEYMPGDVDRYRFTARKGQHLVLAAAARDLTPYLADAVPGWFQATMALFDAQGHEVAYEDDYRFHPDPILHYDVPADGEYIVEIQDAIYRGREDFVYRIAIGELPFVTSVFPLGGPAGARTKVSLTGWNLPARTVIMDGKRGEPQVQALALRSGTLWSNTMPFATDILPDRVEREPNDSQTQAQQVKLPAIVNGTIRQPGDRDVFRFSGHAGDRIVAEVYARRLESPLDSFLELTDGNGHRLAFNDDHKDDASGWQTHHADSLVMATLPATGTYYLRIGDAQQKGGAEYGYRLRISAPQPDFDLRITPSTINAAAGGTMPMVVHAVRRDGFSGDIALALKDTPEGFVLSGAVVPSGQDRVRLTLSVPPMAGHAMPDSVIALHVEGRATIGGRTVTRQAIPAEDMTQAFVSHHLVEADELRVSITARGATRVPIRVLGPPSIKIAAGGSAEIRVAVPPGYRTFEKVAFELSDPPDGVTLRDGSVESAGARFVLYADEAKVKTGVRGNLIVTVSGERVPPAGQKAPHRRVTLGTLPAIPFEIIAERNDQPQP